MSKSISSYYQESGRAGRDGQPAECILFYRSGDHTDQIGMVLDEKNGAARLYELVAYCEDRRTCRHEFLSRHFGEAFDPATQCRKHCDHCMTPDVFSKEHEVDVTDECVNLLSLLNVLQTKGDKGRLTTLQLIDAWRGKKSDYSSAAIPACPYSRDQCEKIIVHLIMQRVVEEKARHTAYNTLGYLVPGPNAPTLRNKRISVLFAQKPGKNAAANSETPAPRKSSGGSVKKPKGDAPKKSKKAKKQKSKSQKAKSKAKSKKSSSSGSSSSEDAGGNSTPVSLRDRQSSPRLLVPATPPRPKPTAAPAPPRSAPPPSTAAILIDDDDEGVGYKQPLKLAPITPIVLPSTSAKLGIPADDDDDLPVHASSSSRKRQLRIADDDDDFEDEALHPAKRARLATDDE